MAEVHVETAKPLSADGPKQCVVIVDCENLKGSLKDMHLNEVFTYSGIKKLLKLFDLTPRVLHMVGPVMLLQHASVATNPDPRIIRRTRAHVGDVVEAARRDNVTTPPTPPGGLWAGEVGSDAIAALLALHYCSSDEYSDHEVVVLSSDVDLWGLHCGMKSPIVMGNLNGALRGRLEEDFPNQRFISAQGLYPVLVGNEPEFKPEINEGRWKRPNRQEPDKPITISSDLSRACLKNQEEVSASTPAYIGTTCVVDPYGLLQFGIRQLSVARLPSVETLYRLLTELGYPRPYFSMWTIPDLKMDDGIGQPLKDAFIHQDSLYEELAEAIVDDEDPLTDRQRATQRVSSTFADRLIFEHGHERLLNHRWMKHLTTGLINDLWTAVQRLRQNAKEHVVVVGGNIELEHCLRVCSAYGPPKVREELRRITYVFAEPPSLRENIGTFRANVRPLPNHHEWFRKVYIDSTVGGRGLHGYVTLPDWHLSRLLRVDHGISGRQLRLNIPSGLTEVGQGDPDTAITADNEGGRMRFRPSSERLATTIRVEGTDCELLGIRRGGDELPTTRWVAHYSVSDDALAPLLVRENESIPGRSRQRGDSIAATVVSRTAKLLRVRLPEQIHLYDIHVGDLPHALKPGDRVTVTKIDESGEKWIVVDIPDLSTNSVPVSVTVSGGTERERTVRREITQDDEGTLVMYDLPFESAPLKVGDRLLALQIFNDPGAEVESKRRIYLALSSALPVTHADVKHQGASDHDAAITTITHRVVPDE